MPALARPRARSGLPRVVRPEWLDDLAPDDPRARHSRNDLRRINRITGALRSLRRALDPLLCGREAMRVVELGAGDGSLMARLARHRARHWPRLQVCLLDRQPCVSAATCEAITRQGWNVELLATDVFAWLREAPPAANEIIIANLFVHHFNDAQVRLLLHGIAQRATAFVCCEPRRSRVAEIGSRCLGVLGCNDVTRHDALASAHAGFAATDLSEAWPAQSAWLLREAAVGPFLHRFVALRADAAP